jgi:beta-lactamase regulating signal transducer with metallopeptidase domain
MTHTVEATAWTLIHFCWQGAVIAGVYRVASAAFSRRASQTRYVLALSALLAMLAAAVITFAWQVRSSAPSVLPYSGMSNAQVSGDFPRILTPGMAAPSRTTADNLALLRSLPGVMGWIDAFWLIGVLALAARGFGGWWVIHRLRITATAQVPAPVRASFERIARTLSLSRPVLLRVSSAIAGPVTMGTLRAIVLLPVSAVTQLSTEELEVVLAHELAHVRRADFLWNLVQTLIETLFFFHPAVWWLSGRVRHERELCCDDLALKICPNPVVYASALFHLEEQRSRQMSLAMALDGHQPVQTLRWRIARILGETIPRNPNRPLRPFSLAALGAVLVVLLLPAPQMIAGLRPPASPATVAAPPAPAALPALPAISSPPAVTETSPAPAPAPAPAPERAPAPEPAAKVAVEPPFVAQAQAEPPTQSPSKTSGTGSSYIDRMKAAGYDVDFDKLIAMKIQNVTPEYARTMGELGFGKLSADDLIACKIHGVTPEVIAEFKKGGLEVRAIQDAISFRIFEVTPAFADGMKAAGFKDLDSQKLVALRVQGVTPEYARTIAQKYPGATVDDVIKTRIFKIDADFIALAQKHGFNNLSLDKLVQLRISGLLDDESVKP